MLSSKPLLQSKTIWVNASVVLVTVLTFLVNYLTTGDVPETWMPYVPSILAIANLVLRILTTKPVSLQSRK